MSVVDLSTLTASDFVPLLDSDFVLSLNATETLTLTLVEVRPAGEPYRPGARPPFALMWRHPHLPRGAYLPQRTYTLHHPTLGTLTLLLVPLGPSAEGMRYEAVFS